MKMFSKILYTKEHNSLFNTSQKSL